MAIIWGNSGAGWQILSTTGFPDEQALHGLVEEAPQMLPVAGSAGLVVVGREVRLGNGYADLIAVEPSGRLSIIEVKLQRNPEARRAVITQVLTYAAYLHGLDVATLEQSVLGLHLAQRDFASLADAAGQHDQTGAFDAGTFVQDLEECLRSGAFRIVLVLDEAPEELARLAAYLEAVSNLLTIDLITVASYDVNGTQIIVPQRVEPDRLQTVSSPTRRAQPSHRGRWTEGIGGLLESIDQAPSENQAVLQRLADWAVNLHDRGLARLYTLDGKSGWQTLNIRLLNEDVSLATAGTDGAKAYLQLWGSVFQRVAPKSMQIIEDMIAPTALRQGTGVKITDELLAALTNAYREAAARSTNSETGAVLNQSPTGA
jgi:hypothetical protein